MAETPEFVLNKGFKKFFKIFSTHPSKQKITKILQNISNIHSKAFTPCCIIILLQIGNIILHKKTGR